MKALERISMRSVSEILSDNEKRRILGGYDYSDYCGQYERRCSCSADIYWSDRTTSHIEDAGYVCAMNCYQAAIDVQRTMYDQINMGLSYMDSKNTVTAWCS